MIMHNSYLLCKKVEKGDKQTASGIILAESKQDESYYEVMVAPEIVYDGNLQRARTCIVEAGDKIMVIDAPIRSFQMDLTGGGKSDYHLFNEFQIVAVVK